MRSIKAVVAGVLFILVVGLTVQLAYIFLAVGYNTLAKSYPFLNGISIYFRYLLGIPVFFLVMFIGGLLTADIARKKVLLHCLLVAILVVGAMQAAMVDYMALTVSGYMIYGLAIVATLAGGWYWQRKHEEGDR